MDGRFFGLSMKGMFPTFPRRKAKKMTFSYQMIGHERYLSFNKTGLKELPCELPKGSTLFADRAYNSYSLEDDLKEMAEIRLIPRRKNNLTKQHSASLEFILNNTRHRIETVFSIIVFRMLRSIRYRTL